MAVLLSSAKQNSTTAKSNPRTEIDGSERVAEAIVLASRPAVESEPRQVARVSPVTIEKVKVYMRVTAVTPSVKLMAVRKLRKQRRR